MTGPGLDHPANLGAHFRPVIAGQQPAVVLRLLLDFGDKPVQLATVRTGGFTQDVHELIAHVLRQRHGAHLRGDIVQLCPDILNGVSQHRVGQVHPLGQAQLAGNEVGCSLLLLVVQQAPGVRLRRRLAHQQLFTT
ncbi:hypothetical protein D3C71_1810910 [compost metagenome]